MRVLAVKWGAVSIVGLLLALACPVPAAATDYPSVDFAAFATTAHGKVGANIFLHTYLRNYGPDVNFLHGDVADLTAPGGTVFTVDYSKHANCTVLVPKKHVRCNGVAMYYPHVPADGDPYTWYIPIQIVSATVTDGKYRIDYPNDPKLSNNAVRLRVTVDGLPKPSPAPNATSPSPKPAGPPSVSPDPTSVSPTVDGTAADQTTTGPLALAAGPGWEQAVFVGTGVILAVAGALILLPLLRSRRRSGLS